MAVLDEQDRFDVWADMMRQSAIQLRLEQAVSGITKTELRAAVDAIDTRLDDNAASANTALPQPARSVLTTQQKAANHCVVRRRSGDWCALDRQKTPTVDQSSL